MIDLRFILREGEKVLQWRSMPTNIAWSVSDDKPYLKPVGASPSGLSICMERNWTEWEDVPLEACASLSRAKAKPALDSEVPSIVDSRIQAETPT